MGEQLLSGSAAGLLVFLLLLALALVFVWMLDSDLHHEADDYPGEDPWISEDTIDLFKAWEDRQEESDDR